MTETISAITGQIYLGNANGYNPEVLKMHSINVVFTFLSTEEKVMISKIPKIGNVLYYYVNIRDSPESHIQIRKELDKLYPKINHLLKKGKKIFFHCYMGISRSATAVIYTLIRYHGLSYEVAYNYVKRRRGVIRPNYQFAKMLEKMN